MENKRKTPRTPVNIIVSFRRVNSYLVTGSRIKDISETGICMPMNLCLPIGYVLEVGIPLNGFNMSIKSLVRVARISDLSNSRYRFDVGLEFTDLSPQMRDILRDYLHRYLPEKDAPKT